MDAMLLLRSTQTQALARLRGQVFVDTKTSVNAHKKVRKSDRPADLVSLT
jgi:hypothetical protein